jgi:hypothetical protein
MGRYFMPVSRLVIAGNNNRWLESRRLESRIIETVVFLES